jgi:hypothetical protein
MCGKPRAKRCLCCLSSQYCSRACQSSDRDSHKLLCRKFRKMPERPNGRWKRAIFFRVNEKTPELVWVQCPRKTNHDDTGSAYSDKIKYIENPFGADRPKIDSREISRNNRRDRSLGYQLSVHFRDTFMNDGSRPNASLIHSVGQLEPLRYDWRGPCVAIRKTDVYSDITLEDFRHLVDYFVAYGNSRIIELDNPTAFRDLPLQKKGSGEILGVKVNSDSEMRLHGVPRYVSVIVPKLHALRNNPGIAQVMTSPLSQEVGVPLRVWRVIDGEGGESHRGLALVNSSLTCNLSDNRAVTCLMLETDLSSPWWGFCKSSVLNDFGNVRHP